MISRSITVRSRAHRALRRLDRYNSIDSESCPDVLNRFPCPLGNDERLIGVYDNSNKEEAWLLVTDQSIWIMEKKKWQKLVLNDIIEVRSPETKSQKHLDLYQLDGSVSRLPIRGGKGSIRDSFSFLGFLNNVIKDLNS